MTVISIKGYKFEMDRYLKNNLDIIRDEAIPNNWDALFIVLGKEGTGKSTFTTQAALYLDNGFNLKKCEFKPEALGEIIDYCEPESSIVWDEAIMGAMTAQHASKISQVIISKLTQIRKKRLKIFICFPYLYLLNKYFVSRCVGAFYIYSKGFLDRGHYYAYNQEQTMWLYSLQKDKYSKVPDRAYKVARKSFYARFDGTFCLPELDYDSKKEKARLEMKDEDVDKSTLRFIRLVNQGITDKKFTLTYAAIAAQMDAGNLSKLRRSCSM